MSTEPSKVAPKSASTDASLDVSWHTVVVLLAR